MPQKQQIAVSIRPWSDRDLALLQRLRGESTTNGRDVPEEILARHERYLGTRQTSRQGPMYAIIVGPSGEAIGSIGYWQRVWQGQHLWEIGWSLLPEFQGVGIAARALQLVIERARTVAKFRFLHAFPAIDNEYSNAICRDAGFELIGEIEAEYPEGHSGHRNDWRLDLFGGIG
jgi:RimJ/RimL family protein N-acetyltransferase